MRATIRNSGMPVPPGVEPGSARLAEFFEHFAEMPHRGSGTPNEPRAARLLSRWIAGHSSALVDILPFAVDLSSGAWSIAIHGTLLCLGVGVLWAAGLGSAAVHGLGPGAARLGWLGTLPWPYMLAALLWTLAILGSRWLMDCKGWNIVSFFVPNADSCSVVATDVPRPPMDPGYARQAEAERWRRRFQEAKNAGVTRLRVGMAHYDSARQLPAGKTPKFLLAALKGGLGKLPTLWLTILALALGVPLALAAFGLTQAAYAGWQGIVLSLVLTLAAVCGLVIVAMEALMAGRSSSLPFVQGINDNLSGSAVLMETLIARCPPAGDQDNPTRRFMAIFTGSEENGLKGAAHAARDILVPAMDVFGPDNVELVNLDTVSGGRLCVLPREVNFSGRTVGRISGFGTDFHAWATGPVLPVSEAEAALNPEQRALCLLNHGSGYGLVLDYADEPIPSCTDLSGVWAALPARYRKELRAFSIVSRSFDGDPLRRPRDYHQLSDTTETLFMEQEPGNFGTVAALALTLAKF